MKKPVMLLYPNYSVIIPVMMYMRVMKSVTEKEQNQMLKS